MLEHKKCSRFQVPGYRFHVPSVLVSGEDAEGGDDIVKFTRLSYLYGTKTREKVLAKCEDLLQGQADAEASRVRLASTAEFQTEKLKAGVNLMYGSIQTALPGAMDEVSKCPVLIYQCSCRSIRRSHRNCCRQ